MTTTIKSACEKICLQELPDEISLGLFISNCPNKCKNCHSPWLREDTGNELFTILPNLLRNYKDKVSCILFMGGDDSKQIDQLEIALCYCKAKGFKTALYSGFDAKYCPERLLPLLDYIKIGSYKEEFGGLNCPTTNQRLYKKIDGDWKDITSQFWTSPIDK
jgi:anaerobic ribonucleoside-triphosphate reductase activating protein